jgi:hypothetical protein
VEVHALRNRGWTISAIARHTGRDRKTVRSYLNGTSAPGAATHGEVVNIGVIGPIEGWEDTNRVRSDPRPTAPGASAVPTPGYLRSANQESAPTREH